MNSVHSLSVWVEYVHSSVWGECVQCTQQCVGGICTVYTAVCGGNMYSVNSSVWAEYEQCTQPECVGGVCTVYTAVCGGNMYSVYSSVWGEYVQCTQQCVGGI